MFSWISNPCGSSSKSKTPFESALYNCTYADWSVPANEDMKCNNPYEFMNLDIIEAFQGKHNEEIRLQKAWLKFKDNFEKHEDKNSSAFRLKNLLLLDRSVEERTMLDTIANYQYNRLFYDRNKSDPFLEESQSVQQFIGSYYLYLKKKADIYQKLPPELFYVGSRKAFINKQINMAKILEFIDNCLQLHKHLEETSEKTKKMNRSAHLVQEILTYMLKSYIFAYSIVSICIHTLLGNVKTLRMPYLNKLEMLLKYFNQDYSQGILNFLEMNKHIETVKAIQYSELRGIDEKYVVIFENYYQMKVFEEKNGSTAETTASAHTNSQNEEKEKQEEEKEIQLINEIPKHIISKLTEKMKFAHIRRKPFIEIVSSDAHEYANAFKEYKNLYHGEFEAIENVVDQNSAQNNNNKVIKKRSLMEDLINERFHNDGNLNGKENTPSSTSSSNKSKFKLNTWLSWENIYCNS